MLQASAVTIAAQLTMQFRERIRVGRWKNGEPIPTLDALSSEFSVAKATIQKAIQALSEERLLSNHRGRRTIVTFDNPTPVYSMVGGLHTPDDETLNFSVTILSEGLVQALPQSIPFSFGKPGKQYMRVWKVDFENGVPYSVSEMFILKTIFDLFPPGAHRQTKFTRLLLKYAKQKLHRGAERAYVTTMVQEEAVLLLGTKDASAARVHRIFVDKKDTILHYGVSLFRGDLFVMERDLAFLIESNERTR